MKKESRIVLGQRAETDIARTFAYIARDKPKAAAKWVRPVRRRIASLSLHPLRCEVIPESDGIPLRVPAPPVRELPGQYRVEDDAVLVLRVFHASRILRDGDLP